VRAQGASGAAPQADHLVDMSGEHEIVSGLNMGADGYIAKPFSVREAVARINAVLRARRHDTNRAALSFVSLTLNTSTNRVTAQGAVLMCAVRSIGCSNF